MTDRSEPERLFAQALYEIRLLLADYLGSWNVGSLNEVDLCVRQAAHLSYALHNDALRSLAGEAIDVGPAMAGLAAVDKMLQSDFVQRFAEQGLAASDDAKYLHLRTRVRLSLQRALVGEIDPRMLAIGVHISLFLVRVTLYVRADTPESVAEDFDGGAISQVVADFAWPERGDPNIELEVIRLAEGDPVPVVGDTELVFAQVGIRFIYLAEGAPIQGDLHDEP
jgi:hypothetical protein